VHSLQVTAQSIVMRLKDAWQREYLPLARRESQTKATHVTLHGDEANPAGNPRPSPAPRAIFTASGEQVLENRAGRE
jgi:hypothetical protein